MQQLYIILTILAIVIIAITLRLCIMLMNRKTYRGNAEYDDTNNKNEPNKPNKPHKLMDNKSHESDESDNILTDMYYENYNTFDILIKYMKSKVGIDDDVLDEFTTMVVNKHKDIDMLNYIIDNVPVSDKREEYYNKTTNIRAKKLAKTIRKLTNNDKLNSLLDIGAIQKDYVNYVADELGISSDDAFGINIEDQEGKVSYNSDEDGIIYYDGVNVPAIKGHESYDIIILTSVLHHVPNDIYDDLIKNISERSNKYVLIKEYDIIDDYTKILVHLQHAIFWGELYKDFTRYDIDKNKLIADFEKNNMKLVNSDGINVFTRAHYYLFKKINE